MKIAITCENNQVFQHFGHTPEFAVYTVSDGQITDKKILPCGETGHGALAGLLAEDGVELLICGGIGGGAQMALANAGIQLIGGASGDVDDVMHALIEGTLNVNPHFQCHHHEHEGGHFCGGLEEKHSCGSHGCGSHGCH